MKRFLIFALFAALILPLPAQSKIVTAGLFEPGGARTAMDKRFEPYDKNTDAKKLDPTSFRVEYNESFWALEIFVEEPLAGKPDEPDNELEVFFVPQGFGKKYYQMFGSVRDREIEPFYYAKFHYDYMRPLTAWNISYSLEPGKGYHVRMIFGWEDFLYCLPVDGAEWKFNIVRNSRYGSQKWNGELHEPKTWGTLVFPKFDEEITRELYKRVILHLADNAARYVYPFDGDRYNNRSYVNWRDKLKGEFSDIAERMGALENSSETVAPQVCTEQIAKMRDKLLTRVFLAACPHYGTGWKTAKDAKTGEYTVKYTVPAEKGVIYLTNLSVDGDCPDKTAAWTILLNDKEIAKGKVSEFPLNIKLGEVKAGDTATVTLSKELPLSFAVESFHNGIMPGPAFDTRKPAITTATPKRDPDGEMRFGDLQRAQGPMNRIAKMIRAKQPPRVFFLGDSITAGFNGEAWNSLAEFRPANLGISGDWIQNVLWRIDLGMFEAYQPELVVLMIGTNNGGYSAEDIAKGIKAIIDRIRKKSPDSKILLLGILPRGKTWPKDLKKNKLAQVNSMIKAYADGKNILFMDMGRLYLADDGETVRKDLYYDMLHPNAAGNAVWAKAIAPVLKQLLPSTKDPMRK